MTQKPAVTPQDRQLFQTLRHTAEDRSDQTNEPPIQRQRLLQSTKEWEDSKQKLSSIQTLLSQAYKELELMENTQA